MEAAGDISIAAAEEMDGRQRRCQHKPHHWHPFPSRNTLRFLASHCSGRQSTAGLQDSPSTRCYYVFP